MTELLDIRPEVAVALAEGRPVVALETTVLAHGLPPPHNLETARAMERASQTLQREYEIRRLIEERMRVDYNELSVARDQVPIIELRVMATERVLEGNHRMLRPGQEYTITQVVSTREDPGPGAESGVTVVIYCQPLDVGAFAAGYVRGVRLVTPVTYGVPDSAPGEGAKDGAQVIPLMTNQEGSITECSGANFMFVRDGRIKLPDRHNVLPGVSMQTVLELADELGLAVDEDDYCTYDVYTADEAFISSTRFCMLPVAAVNGYGLPASVPGPTTARLLDAWRDLVGVDFVRRALEHAPDA